MSFSLDQVFRTDVYDVTADSDTRIKSKGLILLNFEDRKFSGGVRQVQSSFVDCVLDWIVHQLAVGGCEV